MTALPRGAEAAIAAVLVLSMARAFFGPPPRDPDRVAAAGWMVAGVLLLATVLLSDPSVRPRDILAAGSVEAVCIAGWWLRGRRDDGGGESEPDLAGDPPSPDWDDFDRRREDWSRPRELV